MTVPHLQRRHRVTSLFWPAISQRASGDQTLPPTCSHVSTNSLSLPGLSFSSDKVCSLAFLGLFNIRRRCVEQYSTGRTEQYSTVQTVPAIVDAQRTAQRRRSALTLSAPTASRSFVVRLPCAELLLCGAFGVGSNVPEHAQDCHLLQLVVVLAANQLRVVQLVHESLA